MMGPELQLLLKGLIIGVFTSAPVGPIGLLVIDRTVHGGRLHGFVSGLGAATADTFYATLAAFGMSIVLSYVEQHVLFFRTLGALFLFGFGLWFLLRTPRQKNLEENGSTYVAHFFSTLLLTLTNPITIFAFVALFTAFGMANPRAYNLSPGYLVLGVFSGSVLWWLLVCLVCNCYRNELRHPNVRLINRVLGVVFMVSGLVTIFIVRIFPL
ncbi:MAG: LysE family translocator [Kiritimatiellae bacterium]|nr:LysE family translocator [Kiritimatiellia bacterium]